MPLTMIETGTESIIKKISGKGDLRRFLANLGFIEGGKVAVSSEMARRILV